VLRAFSRTAVSVLCLFAFCAVGGASFAQGQPPKGQPAPGQITQPTPTSSETRMGMWRGRPVTYQVINGRNIYQGDIILENVQPMPMAGQGGGVHSDSVGIVNSNYLWPKVNGVAQIPYVIESGSGDLDNLDSAISTYNSTFAGVIQLVPRTTQANYIDIDLNGSANGVCEAEEGYANNGEQFVDGASNCTIATILHEFGHVTGVWHEQSRTDAGNYVTFNYANVIKGSIGNFLPAVDNDQQNLTPYDFASVMEYPAFSFSRNGGPPLDSIPPGMPLSNGVGYSAADVEGIMRLYGVAPAQVTVTSNPPGLVVSVDGNTVTTPMTFSWMLNTTHLLAVATGVQTLSGIIANSSNPIQPTTFYYTYGVWNDGGSQSHMITVAPGTGAPGFPVSAPQVATYSANFIQLVPYTSSVYPSSSGTVALSATPAPQNITVNGVAGTYVVARQQATLTASANSGYSFYEFNNSPYWLPGGLGSNPKTFYVPETGLTIETTAEFTNTPVYTVDVFPDYFSSNLSVNVDATEENSGFWYVPKNFSSFWDPSWTANSNHTLDFNSGLEPFDVNTQFDFSTWTPGGATNPLTITLPATSQSYIATITPEYVPATNFNPCGGTGTITPASTMDGFYSSGTQLTYTETPSPNTGGSPWIFTGWSWDLSGTTNPDTLSPTDESLVYANFNTTTAPLTITSLSPASVASGGPDLTLTINGAGFTQNGTGNPIENVGFNFFEGPFFTPVTFVSSTQLKVTVPAANTATPGTFLLFVENYPSSPWNGCAVFAHQPFYVSQGAGSGANTVTATPATLSFSTTVVDQTSASQAITVKNIGTVATTIGVTASTNFGWSSVSCPVAPATLGGGASCTISATFAPTTSGSLTGNISVTDSASNSPQTVALSGTATPATTTVTVAPTSYNFGSQAVGTTSTYQTFTVQNTGNAYTSIATSTTANYSQVNNCGNLLDAGASCTINVTFTPTANGSLPGTISITDSATNSPQTVTLSGTGTGGTVNVAPTPTGLTFQSQLVGTTSTSQTVSVKNTGTLSTTLSIGAATGDFAQMNNCGASLGPGASCTLTVTFTPTASGTRAGSIAITDQASNSPQSVSLTGTGTVVTITLTPSSLTFSSQTVGTTSPSQTVTVKNTGTASTTLSIGAATGDFAQTNNCTSTLAAGGSCTLTVTFTPTTTGTRTGAISITDQATNSPQSVSLSGTGAAATITVTATPTTLTFPATAVGSSSASQAVTVKNTSSTGNTTVSIAASTNFAQTSNCPVSPATLNAGVSCTVNATFVPTATGLLSGTISVTDSASNSPQTVSLSGTGLTTVTVAPSTLTFGNQNIGTTSTSQPITVKNTGTASTSISVAASANYGQTNNCGTSLAGGATCTINVTFSPTTSGSLPGTITITDSASTSPQSVTLSGTGTTVIVTPAPTSLTFPSQTVGTTSSSMSFTVTNTGTASTPLTIGAATGDFAQTNNCTGSLTATNGSCTVNVTFSPTVSGTRTGSISITDQATNSPQIVPLTGTGASAGNTTVTVTPASEAFASLAVGDTSAAKVITVKNTGTSPTTVSVTASANFSQTNSCPTGTSSLASGASCTISVKFVPTTTGALTGSISVTDNATNSPQTVSLTGTGLVPVALSPTTLAFGSESVGGTSAAKIVTMTSNLAEPLSFTFSASANYLAVAGGTTPCVSPLTAKAKCTISVTFDPTTSGSLPGQLMVNDTAFGNPQTVSLTGTGVAPVVTITTTPASETFAAQTVNTTSAGKAVVVKNTGNTSTLLTVSAATGDFAQTNNCPATLNAAASCTVTVTFTPQTTGTLTGSFTVTDNATNSPQTVKLTGTGTAPVVITITPTSEAFTSTAVGSTSAQKTITVKNTGAQPTSISITSSGDFAAATNTCTGTLSGGGTCTINETFNPTVTGAVSGAITITDIATNSPQTVPLSGTGLSPVTFSATVLAFGSETVGVTTAAKTVTMTNNLSGTLTGISLAASGSYSITGGGTTCGSTLGAATPCTISVTFTPTANGSIDGAVTVTYGAAYSPQEVKLTGTGTGGSTSPLKFTPASLAFTSQAVGSTSAAKTVTLQNTSAGTVTLSSIAPSGNFSYAGSGATPCTSTSILAHNASCTLSVTFSPSIAGAIQGALVISDNGSVGQQVVNLTGTAVNQVTFSPVSLTFTSEAVGGTSPAQTVTLTNNSPTSSLTLNGIVASGDFAIASLGTCGTSVAANSTCTFNVTFTPNKTGSITGAVTVADSAGNTPQVVKLTGTGSS
jgi:Astacin (Peptidase family M12A)/Abnormal spindle-like microcephaly-assoc'd, ASPM-SPD-2-Hydin